jgi:hypothetical protein
MQCAVAAGIITGDDVQCMPPPFGCEFHAIFVSKTRRA